MSYYLHRSPWWFHRFETLSNHFIELIAPFFTIMGRRMCIINGTIQILFQVMDISDRDMGEQCGNSEFTHIHSNHGNMKTSWTICQSWKWLAIGVLCSWTKIELFGYVSVKIYRDSNRTDELLWLPQCLYKGTTASFSEHSRQKEKT